ncbi:MAG TPA: phosphotransferase family protein [Dehalococcoidia bacterium]|nr:phosphotransferase family protein [Dehalococcoidia bacterium]
MTADAAARDQQTSGPDGLDLAALAAYLPRFIPAAEAPLSAELIGGGRSNLTYYIRSKHGEWVLRRPPLGHVLPTAHDMAREYRVISALGPTDVPVPKTLHLCEDPAIIGAPFYVMERVHGVIVHEELPPGLAPDPASRRCMSEAFVEALVRLHAVDVQAVGLKSFGRPQGFMERQVRRWGEQWERSKTRELPDLEALRRRLARAVPESPAPTIVHGDYRIENMIFADGKPDSIAAILDWEMSTLGDPLADLGYALVYWVQEGDSELRRFAMSSGISTAVPGFLTRDELVAEYERRSGRSLANVDFYLAFAFFKLAVIVEGIHARFLAGETRGEGFERLGERVPALARLGVDVANRSGSPALRGEL